MFNGAVNFTCLLSKTDIQPILDGLGKIGVTPSVTPAAYSWVLVLEYNFTNGGWYWRNITVVRGWELRWGKEVVYVLQAPIKRSLGELLKTKDRLTRPFFVEMGGHHVRRSGAGPPSGCYLQRHSDAGREEDSGSSCRRED